MESNIEEDIFLIENDFELIENALYEQYVIGKAKELTKALNNIIEWARNEVEKDDN